MINETFKPHSGHYQLEECIYENCVKMALHSMFNMFIFCLIKEYLTPCSSCTERFTCVFSISRDFFTVHR